jgi:mono/diheme cytochrome c family protein
MRRSVKIAGYVAGALVGLIVVAYGVAHLLSARKLAERYDVALTTVIVSPDSNTIAWGAHLVNSVTSCQDCHGSDLGGKVMSDDAVALMSAPNLTRGRGGRGVELTDADWVRAIRHGVRRDGTSLLVMPSYAYAHLSDRDLAAMVAYLRQIPPVDREVPAFRIRPFGRVLVAAGALDEEFVAKKTPRPERYEAVEPAVSKEYGAYLANVGGCTSCHRPDLRGGPAGPPDAPLAPDISPTGLAGWDRADFFDAMRNGRTPDGRVLSDFMPWKTMRGMTDAELDAIWMYLRGEARSGGSSE